MINSRQAVRNGWERSGDAEQCLRHMSLCAVTAHDSIAEHLDIKKIYNAVRLVKNNKSREWN
ncbi:MULTISPECIES: hypothetical protein [Xanthomonas]|uniref:hypothetical protein n=1 Tax=Xanthomonas TaxID=338 RepID=UPI0011C34CB6|nr:MULTISPECIES: hypothetical protein [Xanthomonas]CAD1791414.1 hypothetical protein XSP_001953 [Xanthomonas sp. CPBF 426]CAG2089482.1 hypothetical protein XCY_001916 [Xanthomonas euroxanthea]